MSRLLAPLDAWTSAHPWLTLALAVAALVFFAAGRIREWVRADREQKPDREWVEQRERERREVERRERQLRGSVRWP